MIASIEGAVLEKAPTRVVLNVNGIGYEVLVPVSTYEKVGEIGKSARLLTYLHVREDILQLYGFHTPAEKSMFSNLLSVSGVGPKLALGILSGCSVEALRKFIAQSDVDSLTRLPGLGRKTAQRLITELRDKFVDLAGAPLPGEPVIGTERDGEKIQEAVLALVALGFNKNIAHNEVARLLNQEPEMPTDELIKRVLQSK